jgi:hypothetical protein
MLTVSTPNITAGWPREKDRTCASPIGKFKRNSERVRALICRILTLLLLAAFCSTKSATFLHVYIEGIIYPLRYRLRTVSAAQFRMFGMAWKLKTTAVADLVKQ